MFLLQSHPNLQLFEWGLSEQLPLLIYSSVFMMLFQWPVFQTLDLPPTESMNHGHVALECLNYTKVLVSTF